MKSSEKNQEEEWSEDWTDNSTRPAPSTQQGAGRGPWGRVRGSHSATASPRGAGQGCDSRSAAAPLRGAGQGVDSRSAVTSPRGAGRGRGSRSAAAPPRGAGRVGRPEHSPPNQTWADGPGGFIPKVEKQRSKEQRDSESRQQFLTPRPDVLPASLITDRVPWTSKIPPHHMLGTDCKALDPIRMQHSCWITCERVGDHFVFKLEGESEQEVRAAAQRVSHLHAQAEAKRFQAETLHIMDVADDSALPRVRLQEYFDASGESLGKLPKFVIPSNPVTFFENTGSDAIQSFLEHIEPMISESRSYHSYVRLDIRLGTFVMTTYPRGASEFDYANFHDMVDEDTMEAFVTDEIGDPKIESTLLQRVSQATHLLVVQNPESKRMIYAATLEFDDPGRRGQLMVDIELSYEAGSTGVSSSRWYRTESCREDVRRLVDVNMVNLSRGFAWHLEMTAANPVDKSTLPKQYDHFIKSLSINPESQSFLVVPPQDMRGAAIPLLSVSQKRIWRFETGFGYWAVDVVEGYGTYHVGGTMTREDPKWSLNVFNTKHQSDFESNAQVKIGERAAWGESEDPVVGLFPPGWQPQSTGDPMGNSVPDTDRSKGLSQLLRLLHGLYDAIVDERASS
ncbi:hypothetical protein IWX49DRAFT_622775 [Phyllosticta citricarpa]|uniref:DUF7905 domain-containing protein n=2 Tax=Phyllosticta TaxID=121621 RepID=A0ABR1L4D0_9PEZI